MRAQEAVPPRPLLGEPIGAPVTANTFVKCRYAQGSPAYQVTQNTQLTQHHKLPAQSALVSQVLPRQQQQQQQLQQMQQLHLQQQQQQQRHYQLMKPSTLMSQKHQEQQHAALATQFVSCAGHRSRSNSSLASQEKRSPSQLSSSCEGLLHSSTKAGGSMRCGYSGETRAVPFNSCAFNNRLSFGSTRSSLGSGQQFSSLRYVSTDSEHNVSAAVASDAAAVTDEPAEATGVPPVPASVSPVCGAAPSSGLSVGGESCTDWGVISAENGNSNNDNSSSTSGSNVFVAVRVRPLSESERRQGDSKSVSVVAPQSLLVTERGAGGGPRGRRVRRRCFLFDSVFGESAGQEEVFQLSTSPLLQELFKGTNVSIFAYGATAAGKTYTMLGTETRPGVMPRALQLLFQQVSKYRLLRSSNVFWTARIMNHRVLSLGRKKRPEIISRTALSCKGVQIRTQLLLLVLPQLYCIRNSSVAARSAADGEHKKRHQPR